MLPIYDIHHDEQYYENPSKFDPDRFSDENKKHIKPFTYLPFGAGPRICIGKYKGGACCKSIFIKYEGGNLCN